jgi:tetratricopeptide (TPR) repeat protein
VERVAIVEFDNQSSQAAANQLGAKVAQIATLELSSSPSVFAYVTASSAEAPIRRATQILTGYLTAAGESTWTLHAHLRDLAANRTLRSFAVTGSTPGALADGVAAQFGKPDFSAAKLDPAALEAALYKGGDTSILGELARLRLTPLPADFASRAAALERLSGRMPADSEAAFNAATLLMQARHFTEAAKAYHRALRADPDWGNVQNEAAFGFAYAGDVPAALAAIEAYRKLEPRSANPDDSQGEILFALRRFAESERAFLAAFDKQPGFFSGAPLRKAAEARRAAGNQAEADRLFARYREVNAKRPLIDLEKAQWDYTSGRQQEALAAAEALAAKTNASAAWTQLVAWRAMQGGDAVGAAKLAVQTARTPADQQAAVTALFAVQPEMVKQFPPAAAPLARQAHVYTLVLARRWAEAIPLIAAERDALPPATAGFWQALLARAYAEAGQAEKAKAESRFAPIPRTIGDPTWDFLMFPAGPKTSL